MSRKNKHNDETLGDTQSGEENTSPPQAGLELDAPDPRDAEIAALKAQLEQAAKDRADAEELRAMKAKAAAEAAEAKTLKTYRVTIRHVALRPRKLSVNGKEVELGVQEVRATSPDHAKGVFIQKVAEAIKHSDVADAERYTDQFCSSAPGASWDIVELKV
jgi:hypothetical protein